MHIEKKLIMFGTGNIGRSFIGQLFSRGGYEVVFVDVDRRIIDEMNRRRSYRIVIKSNDSDDRTIDIDNVRAVDAHDGEAVALELRTAAFAATAVGKSALASVFPTLARGLTLRARQDGSPPLDIILAENARDAAGIARAVLADIAARSKEPMAPAGLVETSIGKMVPIMPDEIREKDPLLVHAEPYNTLIVDRTAFLTPLPDIPDLQPVDNIDAYVGRKLYMHNLGHAAAAYLGFAAHPDRRFIYEMLADTAVRRQVRQCLLQSAVALSIEYRDVFAISDLVEHAFDLLHRFQNRALGDTVFRVGRDLRRKLDKTDRLVGAMLLAARHGLPFDAIASAAAAAFSFAARDERGREAEDDAEVRAMASAHGIAYALETISGLSPAVPVESAVIDAVACAAKTPFAKPGVQ